MTPEMNSMAVSCYTRFSPSSLYTMQVYITAWDTDNILSPIASVGLTYHTVRLHACKLPYLIIIIIIMYLIIIIMYL